MGLLLAKKDHRFLDEAGFGCFAPGALESLLDFVGAEMVGGSMGSEYRPKLDSSNSVGSVSTRTEARLRSFEAMLCGRRLEAWESMRSSSENRGGLLAGLRAVCTRAGALTAALTERAGPLSACEMGEKSGIEAMAEGDTVVFGGLGGVVAAVFICIELPELDAAAVVLAVEDEDEATGDRAEKLGAAVPKCIGGRAGTGGMPGDSIGAAGALREGPGRCCTGPDVGYCRFRDAEEGAEAPTAGGSETRRLGCSRWGCSLSETSRGGGSAPATLSFPFRAAGLISRSSCELLESLELATGEVAVRRFSTPGPDAGGGLYCRG